MEPLFKKEDFSLFEKYGGKKVKDAPKAHAELKALYEKLGYICGLLPKSSYKVNIIKNPQNRGHIYENYHWAKIYPIEIEPFIKDKIAFVIGTTKEGFNIHIDGIKNYADNPETKLTEKKTKILLNVNDKPYPEIVDEIINYMKTESNYNALL
ncbi:hypothetical protein FACS189430_02210 [Bacteroidia bacterium]|nr:hypothetical protein FACS189430_02210 [Bacteroidia bacterium]